MHVPDPTRGRIGSSDLRLPASGAGHVSTPPDDGAPGDLLVAPHGAAVPRAVPRLPVKRR
jgi:hypothetical protein